MIPNRSEDRVIRFLQFTAHSLVGHFAQIRMRPGMIPNLMSFADRAPQDVGMVRRVLAHHKKRRFHMMRREEVEQLWRENLVRTIVKRQSDIGSIDVNRTEGDLRLSWRSRGGRRGRGIASFNGLRGRGALPGNGPKNQETDRGKCE